MNIMLAWKRSTGRSDYDGIVSPAYCVYRPIVDLDTKYYHFLFRTDVVANLFKQYSTGIIDSRLRLYPDKFLALKMIVPPLPEQQSISAYLDRQCAHIDNIIEKTKASIEEYKKLRQAVITQAVTKGVRGDRPMKDSGIEWIGEIPEEWEMTSVTRIATIVRGASPRPAGDPRYFHGSDIPWITVAEVTKGDGKFIYETETFLTTTGAEKSRIVEAGTLLLSNSGATLGVPKITCITGCINDGSVAFYDLKINQTYLLYIFKGLTFELRKQMQGYGQPNLNTSIIKAIKIPLATDEEQQEIAAYLDQKCAEIDNLIAKKEQFLTELESYKKSMIYEYVTGKKEVPQA